MSVRFCIRYNETKWKFGHWRYIFIRTSMWCDVFYDSFRLAMCASSMKCIENCRKMIARACTLFYFFIFCRSDLFASPRKLISSNVVHETRRTEGHIDLWCIRMGNRARDTSKRSLYHSQSERGCVCVCECIRAAWPNLITYSQFVTNRWASENAACALWFHIFIVPEQIQSPVLFQRGNFVNMCAMMQIRNERSHAQALTLQYGLIQAHGITVSI